MLLRLSMIHIFGIVAQKYVIKIINECEEEVINQVIENSWALMSMGIVLMYE